jgi:hypothetical protein
MIEFALQDFDDTHSADKTTSAVIESTRIWLEKAIIGLNLCPFAKAVYVKRQIRFAISGARDSDALAEDLMSELMHLANEDAATLDTTLLIHPHALMDFPAYNDFLSVADAFIDTLGLAGMIQIASFHPDYRFEGSGEEDIENYTNRSPYPMLHLLREGSVEKAVSAFPDASEIYLKNMETLRGLGLSGWNALFKTTDPQD